MSLLATALLAATPSATPSPSLSPGELPRGLDPTDVTPGVAGFLATAFMVVVSIFLIVNLVSRMRRMRHRAMLLEAREAAERDGTAGPELDGDPRRDAGVLPEGHEVVRGEAREVPERDDPGTPGPRAT
ncbi:hypothetical protein [Quadrisphaera sp. INWT6]|uniref:hypothetical protein n=1 Tax=Quadrisphaera sp. INWT6 TaxID=2596917 RepID=UPI001891FFA4|nr:hypothetical protein [Quadrisphaera sp. INWT6]MBF5080425.1 hypothetical protein [Quadrisphaera sp. INWT6]